MNFRDTLELAASTARYLRSQWWPRERIDAFQSAALAQSVRHAIATVPHYADVSLPRSPRSAAEWLQNFPALTKADLQEAGDRLLSSAFEKAGLHCSVTSGSTGEPTRTYFDDRSWLIGRYALKARRILTAVRPFRQRILVVSESAGDGMISGSPLLRQLVDFRTLHIGDAVDDALAVLQGFRPTVLQGFPSYLHFLATELRERNLTAPRVPVVFTSSEVLTARTRETIETTFDGNVIDTYGTTEFKEIAVQCPAGRYHVNFEHVYVESVADPAAAHPRLLITTLSNRAMPLIRYEVGDCGEVGYDPCTCGRQGPYLRALTGRSAELLEFSDGTVIPPYPITLEIERFEEIRSYTVLHRAPDDVQLEVFAKPALTEDRAASLLASVRDAVPAGVEVSLVSLRQQPAAGKRIAVRRCFDGEHSAR